jgi:pyruvate formate lyase activating enzyme
MGIPIKGIEKLSVIDYPGKTCLVAFLAGCNFRCPYCQNPDLIERPGDMEDIPEGDVLELLRSRRKWIDGVCISGGEPCLHRGLAGFIRKVKGEGFLVKLDTNGSRPSMLGELLKEGLLDYVAMDIKAPIEDYGRVARVGVEKESIRRSAEMIMKSGVEYEFRTTVVPGLFGKDDMEAVGKWLRGARRYFIQQFRPGNALDRGFRKERPYPASELEGLAGIARKYFKEVGVRS